MTKRRLLRDRLGLPLLGRKSMQRQGVNAVFQLMGKNGVDLTMAGNEIQAGKIRGYRDDFEMSLGTRRDRVVLALVFHDKNFGFQFVD